MKPQSFLTKAVALHTMQCYKAKDKSNKQRIEYAERVEQIKRLALIAMFSDDELMETLVLKGGNAIDLIYNIGHRSSRDLDFSIQSEFTEDVVNGFKDRAERLLQETFKPNGLEVFDVTFTTKPRLLNGSGNPELAFWGGYEIAFKVIHILDAEVLSRDSNEMRKAAFVLGKANSPKFSIEISKYEYCGQKQEHEIDGYRVYTYSPEMIVAEKLRAICQKTDEFARIVLSESKGERARDFVDIYMLIKRFGMDLTAEGNRQLLKNIFQAKRVPAAILLELDKYRELHRTGFPATLSTVKAGVELLAYDSYFDYVVRLAKKLHALGIE